MSTAEYITLTIAALVAGYFVLAFVVTLFSPGPPLWRRVLKLFRQILDAFWGAG